jgi:hypothetical protein
MCTNFRQVGGTQTFEIYKRHLAFSQFRPQKVGEIGYIMMTEYFDSVASR